MTREEKHRVRVTPVLDGALLRALGLKDFLSEVDTWERIINSIIEDLNHCVAGTVLAGFYFDDDIPPFASITEENVSAERVQLPIARLKEAYSKYLKLSNQTFPDIKMVIWADTEEKTK